MSFPSKGPKPCCAPDAAHDTLCPAWLCLSPRVCPEKAKSPGVSKASGILTLPSHNDLPGLHPGADRARRGRTQSCPVPIAGCWGCSKTARPLTCKLTLSKRLKNKILEDKRGNLLLGITDGTNAGSKSQSRRSPSARHASLRARYFPVINSNRCASVMRTQKPCDSYDSSRSDILITF